MFLWHLIAFLSLSCASFGKASYVGTYPETKSDNIVDSYHGYTVEDPYRWLESIDAPEVKNWVQSQTQFSKDLLLKVEARPKIDALLKSFGAASFAPPVRLSNDQFLVLSKGSLYLGPSETQGQTLLVDIPALMGNPKAAITDLEVSPNGKMVRLLVGYYGADFPADIVVFDLEKRSVIEKFQNTGATNYTAQHWIRGPFWLPDSSGYIYTKVITAKYLVPLKSQIVLRDLSSRTEKVLFEMQKRGDETQMWYARPLDDGKHAVLVSQSSETEVSQLALISLKFPGKVLWLKKERTQQFVYLGQDEKSLYFRTDKNANNLKVVAVDLKKALRGVLSERDVTPSNDPLFTAGFANGKVWTATMNPKKIQQMELKFYSGKGRLLKTVVGLVKGTFDSFRYSPATQDLYFHYNDYFQPRTLMKVNLNTLDESTVHMPAAPFDKADFSVRTVTVSDGRGPDVYVTLMQPSHLKATDSAPLYLHFYGNIAGALTPQYNPKFLAFLRMGGRVAIAHVRGGAERGRDWVNGGRALNKKNTFKDVIRVTEKFQKHGLTTPSQTLLVGRSSGGFNVTALANLRPDLFGVITATVPMGDMVRYTKLAWGNRWHYEYGDPRIKKDFENLYRFSPYHNVKQGGRYPSMIFFTADHDDRVNSAHGYKLTAAFQKANASDQPILMVEDKDASHGSKVESLDELTFAAWRMSLTGF